MHPIPFDKREGYLYLDGNFVEWKDAKVHVLTHCLHYGSSCFEGIRIYNGKVFKNKEHAQRLIFSASELELTLKHSVDEIMEICVESCKRNNVQNGYIRPVVWRGSDEMRIRAQMDNPHFSVSTWNWPNYPEEKKTLGIHLVVAKYKRASPESGPVCAKIGGLYVSSTLAVNDAYRMGYDDCLMLDYRNFVAESSSSNLFFVFDGEIHTPIADCFLNGITRQTVINLAKNLGYKVVERHILLEELKDAEDGFCTGTAAEIVKLSSISSRDGSVKYEFRDNSTSLRLLKEYRNLVNED